jgi:hypothetical protein
MNNRSPRLKDMTTRALKASCLVDWSANPAAVLKACAAIPMQPVKGEVSAKASQNVPQGVAACSGLIL